MIYCIQINAVTVKDIQPCLKSYINYMYYKSKLCTLKISLSMYKLNKTAGTDLHFIVLVFVEQVLSWLEVVKVTREKKRREWHKKYRHSCQDNRLNQSLCLWQQNGGRLTLRQRSWCEGRWWTDNDEDPKSPSLSPQPTEKQIHRMKAGQGKKKKHQILYTRLFLTFYRFKLFHTV